MMIAELKVNIIILFVLLMTCHFIFNTRCKMKAKHQHVHVTAPWVGLVVRLKAKG